MADQIATLTFTDKQKRWRFPRERFVEYSREDEKEALRKGWSGWGGEPYEAIVTWTIPRAMITKVHPDGSVDFVALSEIRSLPLE